MKFVQDFFIKENINLNDEHFVLELQAPQSLPEIYPGQFCEVLVPDSPSTFLRRPISIHFADYKNNCLSLFIKRAGEGTRKLGIMKKGEKLNLIYPLGNWFDLPEDDNFLLIGGGCGVAPLLFLTNYLHNKGFKPKLLIGARSKTHIHRLELFKQFAQVYIITEDGSEGEKGLVSNHSILKQNWKKFYVCGPELMLKSMAIIAKDRNIDCEVSLENKMACGIGACLCCVVDIKEKGNVCVCTEGPVFNTKVLKF